MTVLGLAPLAEILWPLAVVSCIGIVCWASYLTSDARKIVIKDRARKAEADAQRAYNLEVEREKTLRSQTTYPWPTPDANVVLTGDYPTLEP